MISKTNSLILNNIKVPETFLSDVFNESTVNVNVNTKATFSIKRQFVQFKSIHLLNADQVLSQVILKDYKNKWTSNELSVFKSLQDFYHPDAIGRPLSDTSVEETLDEKIDPVASSEFHKKYWQKGFFEEQAYFRHVSRGDSEQESPLSGIREFLKSVMNRVKEETQKTWNIYDYSSTVREYLA